MNKQIIEVLKQIKTDYGDSVFLSKNRVTSLLSDYAGDKYKGEINLLNITLSLGILKEIKSAPAEYSNIRCRYIMKLKTEYFLTEEQAEFAIDVWGIIEGVIDDLEINVESEASQINSQNENSPRNSEINAKDTVESCSKTSESCSKEKINISTNSISARNGANDLIIDEVEVKLAKDNGRYKKGQFILKNKTLKFEYKSGFSGTIKELIIQLDKIKKLEIIKPFSRIRNFCIVLMIVGLSLLIPSLIYSESYSASGIYSAALVMGYFLSVWSPLFMLCMSFVIPKKAIRIKSVYSQYTIVIYDIEKLFDEIKTVYEKVEPHVQQN
jgi:hypothetical protein